MPHIVVNFPHCQLPPLASSTCVFVSFAEGGGEGVGPAKCEGGKAGSKGFKGAGSKGGEGSKGSDKTGGHPALRLGHVCAPFEPTEILPTECPSSLPGCNRSCQAGCQASCRHFTVQ